MAYDRSKIGVLSTLLDCLFYLEQSDYLWHLVEDSCFPKLDVLPTKECLRDLICVVADAQHSLLTDFVDGTLSQG